MTVTAGEVARVLRGENAGGAGAEAEYRRSCAVTDAAGRAAVRAWYDAQVTPFVTAQDAWVNDIRAAWAAEAPIVWPLSPTRM